MVIFAFLEKRLRKTEGAFPNVVLNFKRTELQEVCLYEKNIMFVGL